MIPDTAMIVTAYAVARLLNAYILVGPKWTQLRQVVAVGAIAVIGFFALDIVLQSGQLSI